MVSAFAHKLILPSLVRLALAHCRSGYLNLVRLEFCVVYGLSCEGNFLSLVDYWRLGHSFDMFWTKLSFISCRSVEFGSVFVFIVGGGGWPFNIHLERDIAFLVFSFVVERGLFLDVLVFIGI